MLSSITPYNLNEINFDKIVFDPIKKKNGKKIIPVKYINNTNLVFQTPKLYFNNKFKHYDSHDEIEIYLEGPNNTETGLFIDFLNKIEDTIKKISSTYVSEWFDNSQNSINFQKIIRTSNDKKNCGSLKLKIIKTKDFETKLIHNNKNISVNEIPNDAQSKLIIEFFAVWINDTNDFGIFFRPVIISFDIIKINNYNYNFIEDDDSDEMYVPDTDFENSSFLKIFGNKGNVDGSTQNIAKLYNDMTSSTGNVDASNTSLYNIKENTEEDDDQEDI